MSTRRSVLVVSEHDLAHPAAGERERYVHEVTRRWADGGTRVTWAVTGAPGREVAGGVERLRFARPSALVAWLLRRAHRFDAVVDATGWPVAPLLGRRTPVVRLEAGSPGTTARRVGRHPARWGADHRATVVPSPSARHQLRGRPGLRGPVLVAPPGAPAATGDGERAPDPLVVVPALGPHLDVLLRDLPRTPRLRVEVLGDGPDLARWRRVAHEAGVTDVVAFRGRLPDAGRIALLRRAWLLVCAADSEVSPYGILEAAAHGVPCVGPAGARDFVREGEVVRSAAELAPAVARHLTRLADPAHAEEVARRCRAWAAGFRWDRTARLVAAAVEHEIGAARRDARRRRARFDIAAVLWLPEGVRVPSGALRVTDEVAGAGVLLNGCDEFDALGVLERLGIEGARVRLATHDDLLLGPCPPVPLTEPTREVDDRVCSH
ncbi:glycosyltransferase [Amycolatopsis sp. cmx-4-61]|uniref:glycosyltransferase n=1 Tax=Amycolatopsis sp. cmx-4-61 TaxID=2790937 RepID=UPI00397897DA